MPRITIALWSRNCGRRSRRRRWAVRKARGQKHVARGKLLPRERVQRLLDPGSPFLEIGALAANGLYTDEAPGAGMIAGHRPGAWAAR